jgi:N-acetylmuramoyl-L-alanine amidase
MKRTGSARPDHRGAESVRWREVLPPPARGSRNPAAHLRGDDSARLAGLAVAEVGRIALLLADPRRVAGFAVLRASGIPSVLVELGFLSQPGDEALLRRASHRRRLAGALAHAVDGWFAGADRPLVVDGVG